MSNLSVPNSSDLSGATSNAAQQGAATAEDAAAGTKFGEAVAAGAALGGTLGTIVPGIGNAVGAIIGGIAGAADFLAGVNNKQVPFDDSYFAFLNSLGGTGNKLASGLAQKIGGTRGSAASWPAIWTGFANGAQIHSPAFANAIAGYLGWPPNGQPLPAGLLASIAQVQGSAFAPVSFAPGVTMPMPVVVSGSKVVGNGFVPAGTPAPKPTSQWSPGGIGTLTADPLMAGAGFGGLSLNPTQLATFLAANPSVAANLATSAPVAAPTGPNQVVSETQAFANNAVQQAALAALAAASHPVIYAAATGNTAASNKILNATSAASSPEATPAQTALADALALAHKIQVHAQYVQKWFGPAEAAKYFNANYITVKDLG